MAGKIKDLTGCEFGRLKVIEMAGYDKNRKVLWLCKCECGAEKIVRGNDLKGGKQNSCGCLRNEKSQERMTILIKEKWADEEFKKKRSNVVKKQWENEDFKKMQVEKQKKLWENEDFKQKQSEKTKKQWENEDFRIRFSGENSPQWRGGITPITEYLRQKHVQWFEKCKYQANYVCQLTGEKGQLHTHHLKSFNIIVREAHDLYNITVKPFIKDYTEEELKLLEEYVASWHKDNSNAVVLCEDVHNLFHKLYGYGNNTPEQYIEFKERYLAGEFKEI